MKKLFLLMLVVLATTAYTQEITELREAVIIAPNVERIAPGNANFSFIVKEKSHGEFAEDPIAFLKANFNIHEFILISEKENYDSYMLTFKSSNGQLDVDYDKEGRLVKNRQYFTNVKLPAEIKNRLDKDYRGWTVVKSKYFSKGKGELTEKALYRIKVANGNEVRRVKLEPQIVEGVVLAKN